MTSRGKGIAHVFVIEDNPADIRLIREALGEMEVEVKTTIVQDGEEALAQLNDYKSERSKKLPDLIILDLNIPKVNGFEVLKAVKIDQELKAIPVIVLSSSNDKHDIQQCYNLHANSYITKPVDLDPFIKVVRSIEDFWLKVTTLPPS